MKQGARRLVYDNALRLEAYRLRGIVRPFPSHFHDHYVVGFVEDGERVLTCKNQDHSIGKGSVLLFNPGDDHACVQRDGGTLDYRGFNISKEVMLDLAEEATGRRELPRFSPCVVMDEGIAGHLRPLHEAVMKGVSPKSETLRLLTSSLIRRYSRPFGQTLPDCREEIERACAFMERHYARRVSLEEICRHTGMSGSTLLRAFVRAKGVTPYRYLVTIRVARAKGLLEQGVPPVEAALMTGFSDQSHFTNCFSRLTGLAPGDYREIFPDRDKETAAYER